MKATGEKREGEKERRREPEKERKREREKERKREREKERKKKKDRKREKGSSVTTFLPIDCETVPLKLAVPKVGPQYFRCHVINSPAERIRTRRGRGSITRLVLKILQTRIYDVT